MNEADRTAIRKNTVELVEDMELPTVLDLLFQAGTITRAQHEELMPNTKAERRNKVREFLGVISRRGPNAFNDLCDALLKSDQGHLAELLCPGKTLAQEQAKAEPQMPSASSAEVKTCMEEIIDTPLAEITSSELSRYRQLVIENKAYKMTQPRGRALVINNAVFAGARANGKDLPDRAGTDSDAVNLNIFFQDFKFELREERDLTVKDMQEAIEAETKGDHSAFGMFVLVILSHGENGAVYGVDGKLLEISEVKKLLGIHRFPTMSSKPKLILLQACQGTRHDGQVATDGPETDAAPSNDVALKPEFADILIAYPTASGNVSYRDKTLGTWFIRTIVQVFRRCAWKDHVVDMLTEVRQKVYEESKRNNRAQGTFDENHLHKKLYLLPGFSDPLP